MREISLIKDIEYNYEYKKVETTHNTYIDGGSYIYDVLKLTKEVWKADELITLTEEQQQYVDSVTDSFIETFKERGGATHEQINFANETAKIVFGVLKEILITVIPAPCGFGKSSISFEILKELCKQLDEEKTTNGLILVTDRLDSLRETKELLESIGYDNKCYILESWNEEICINKKVKSADSKMCTPKKCKYFERCKICQQQNEQYKYPLLLITNARLRECGTSINQYSRWKNGERTVLLIDERPDMLDSIKVNKKLLNEISTELSKATYDSVEDKTKLENMFNDIKNRIEFKMQKLRNNYKRFIVSNINNEPICLTDNEFTELWDKYMGKNYKRELEHIHTVLTKGGFYVYEKNTEFITTIGSKDFKEMYSEKFKTIIFDGTGLYDPLYEGVYESQSLKYLDIENTRLYENLNINAYMKHKITKSKFDTMKYLDKACGRFVDERMKNGFNNRGYVVSYSTQSASLSENIKGDNIERLSETECHYFGNTKGKNNMQNCNIMFQFGWDTMPDYEYVIQWLCTSINWEHTLQMCSDIKKAEKLSELLEVKERENIDEYNGNTFVGDYKEWKFGLDTINRFKWFYIVTNFYQEVHRIKLRNYNCTKEKIEVNIFAQKNIIYSMIEQLFPKCNFTKITEELNCFKEGKITGKNQDTHAKKILTWFTQEWDGNEIRTKDMLDKIGITQKKFDKAKENNTDLKELINKYMFKRGCYKKVS